MKTVLRLLVLFGIVGVAYAMPRNVEDDPLQKFMFRVRIPGYPAGMGFTTVGAFVREVQVIEYLEGMYEYPHKLAGRQKVTDIPFTRGAYRDRHMYDLYHTTLTNPAARTTVTVEVSDRFGRTAREFVLAQAWASRLETEGLDAASDDVLIDNMTITFEYFLNDTSAYGRRG